MAFVDDEAGPLGSSPWRRRVLAGVAIVTVAALVAAYVLGPTGIL